MGNSSCTATRIHSQAYTTATPHHCHTAHPHEYQYRSWSSILVKPPQTTQRIAICIEFDGHQFHGWQRQDNASTAQGALEKALSLIEGEHITTICSGRTDSGVHGEAMLVHADVSAARWLRSPKAYTQGLNQKLQAGIIATGVRAVEADFHARFSCLERTYRYQIWNRSTPSALSPWRHWWIPRTLNIDAMQTAAQQIIGEHDFTSFRAANCQAHSPIRRIHQISLQQHDCDIQLTLSANGFLYHMVRNIVGSLVQVGTGRWQPDIMGTLLQQKNRSLAAATAPAHGLYFINAKYPDFNSRDLIGYESPNPSK